MSMTRDMFRIARKPCERGASFDSFSESWKLERARLEKWLDIARLSQLQPKMAALTLLTTPIGRGVEPDVASPRL